MVGCKRGAGDNFQAMGGILRRIFRFTILDFLIVLVGLIAFAGYAVGPFVPFWTVRKAEDAASAQLTDPDSAKFRNIRYGYLVRGKPDHRIVCGEINAKNRMGGYVGYTPFNYINVDSKESIIILPDKDDTLYDFDHTLLKGYGCVE